MSDLSGGTARDARRLHLLAARRHGAGHADRICADRLRRRADAFAGCFQFADRRPEHHQRRRQLSADGGPVLHAGRRADESRRPRQAHCQCRAGACRPRQGRIGLRHDPGRLRAFLAVGIGRRRRCRAGRPACAHDGRGRPPQDVCDRARRRQRRHRARHSAEHRLCAVRRYRRRVDLEAVPGRHLSRD